MDRYIDADELVKKKVLVYSAFNDEAEAVLLDDIEDAPTITPEDIRPKGKWTEVRNAYHELEGWIHEECGRETKCAEKFCPSCGARMEV